MKITTKILTITAIIILALLTFYSSNKPNQNELKKVNVKLKWLNQAQFTGMYVAKEKNFYKKYGLDVTLSERNPDEETVSKEVGSGNYTFGIISSFELIKSIEQGTPVTAIMAIYQQSPSVIISKAEKNIKSPADLKNKTLGIVGNKEENKTLYATQLKSFNIEPDQIKFVNVGFDQITDLLNDKVDAVRIYRTTDLYRLEKEKIAYNIIKPEDYDVTAYDDIIITETNTLTHQENIVKSFIKATREGWEYAIANQNEAIQIAFQNTNPKYKTEGIDFQKYIFENSLDLIKENPNQTIGEMTYQKWYKQYQQLESQGLVSNIDVKKIFTTITK